MLQEIKNRCDSKLTFHGILAGILIGGSFLIAYVFYISAPEAGPGAGAILYLLTGIFMVIYLFPIAIVLGIVGACVGAVIGFFCALLVPSIKNFFVAGLIDDLKPKTNSPSIHSAKS